MAEELVDPTEHGLWIAASSEEKDAGQRMKVPSTHVDEVLSVLRTAAAGRANYALNAALLKWQALPVEMPGLIDRHAVDNVLTMAESAVEALRVLHELAGEIVDMEES